jgi:hypothetical protein
MANGGCYFLGSGDSFMAVESFGDETGEAAIARGIMLEHGRASGIIHRLSRGRRGKGVIRRVGKRSRLPSAAIRRRRKRVATILRRRPRR